MTAAVFDRISSTSSAPQRANVRGHDTEGATSMHDKPTPEPVRIPLHNRAGEILDYAIVDAEHAALAELRWCRDGNGYVVRNVPRDVGLGPRRNIKLHREVLGLVPGDGIEVDHLNGNKCDNRCTNLRVATHAQNNQNVPPRVGGSSAHRGVCWDKRYEMWKARGTLDSRGYHLGYFDDELEAAAVARAWRIANLPYANEDRNL